MKRVFLLFYIGFCTSLMSANAAETEPDLNAEIYTLKSQLKTVHRANLALKDSVMHINMQLKANVDSVNSLKVQFMDLSKTVEEKSSRLSEEIGATNSNLEVTQESNRKDFRKHAFYVGGIFLATLLGFLVLILFLRNRMNRGSATINEIKSVQKRIQEESLKLDNKLISIVEKENIVSGESGDHSLAVKVADEVVRIEMNLFRMDKSIKGYKQLSKAVERIKNNFTAQGYEIVDMLGATYNEGMRINADFVIDESLAEGSRIITSITKPQINYMGQMIQKAIVTVSQNI